MENRQLELMEFVRSVLPYTEQELKSKTITQFFDIVDRAKKKVESEAKANKPHQTTAGAKK